MIDKIINQYSNNSPYINGWSNMKRAAVAILLTEIDNDVKIVFQVRAFHMKSQPGDISFPGGRIDTGETAKEAVIREICEELGLSKEDFEIKEALNVLVTYSGLIIHPYLGYIKNYTNVRINVEEVDHLFLASIDKLKEISPLVVDNKITVKRDENFPYNLINGGSSYKFKEGIYKSLFYKYEDYTIWGITALILKDFLEGIN